MILVVEGISASGKTTWCTKHGGQHVIPENGRFENEPDRIKDPVGAATFWAERNVDRWQAALTWYSAMDEVLPGRVRFGFPSEMPTLKSLDGRYAVAALIE